LSISSVQNIRRRQRAAERKRIKGTPQTGGSPAAMRRVRPERRIERRAPSPAVRPLGGQQVNLHHVPPVFERDMDRFDLY